MPIDVANQTTIANLENSRKPQTQRGEERYGAILAAADKLFLSRGYMPVSLDDVIALAGGSKSSICRYFGSKKGLLLAVIQCRCECFFSQMPTIEKFSDNITEDLLKQSLYAHQVMSSTEHIAFLRLLITQASRDKEVAEYAHRFGDKVGILRTVEILEKAHQQRKLNCLDPKNSALFIFGVFRYVQWQLLMGINTLKTVEQVKPYYEKMLGLFVAAHRP